jgi:hypothetical protein
MRAGASWDGSGLVAVLAFQEERVRVDDGEARPGVARMTWGWRWSRRHTTERRAEAKAPFKGSSRSEGGELALAALA